MTIELSATSPRRWPSSCGSAAIAFTADVSEAEGGADTGPSPHDLYDAALGACKALTVMWYARKKGIPVEDIHTRIERDDSQERSGVYKLAAKLQVKGDLTDAQLQELHAVAQKCPVHKLMTTVTTEITTDLERLP
jgi:putative redox protein